MKPYPDTNFFTRLYLALPDSEEADALLEEARTGKAAALPVTWLHRVEMVNAFQLSVFVGRLPGQTHVTPEQAASALAGFREDIRTGAFFTPRSSIQSQLVREKTRALETSHQGTEWTDSVQQAGRVDPEKSGLK
jgi:hypothetical protein